MIRPVRINRKLRSEMSPTNASNTSLPNVIFIVADQLKATALRMYSEIGIETPSLGKNGE